MNVSCWMHLSVTIIPDSMHEVTNVNPPAKPTVHQTLRFRNSTTSTKFTEYDICNRSDKISLIAQKCIILLINTDILPLRKNLLWFSRISQNCCSLHRKEDYIFILFYSFSFTAWIQYNTIKSNFNYNKNISPCWRSTS